MVDGKKDVLVLNVTKIIIRVSEGEKGCLKSVDRTISNFKRDMEKHKIPFEIHVSGGNSFEVKK